MSKAMVIFDKPSKCMTCPCSRRDPFSTDTICGLTDDNVCNGAPIPDGCPIIHLSHAQLDTILEALKRHMEGRIV